MASLKSIRPYGNQLIAFFDDGSTATALPTPSGIFIVTLAAGGTHTGGGGGGGTGGGTGDGTIYNPWASYSISGTWADHMSYSLGGIDYPLGYGTNIAAPSAGVLHTSGGSGEYACGWIGSAGRRSILYLDTDIARTNPSLEPKEGTGAMHAIVFQHQSDFGTNGRHYAKGQTCGVSGASADGSDYGGEVHLHVHGLTAGGQRVDFLNFL